MKRNETENESGRAEGAPIKNNRRAFELFWKYLWCVVTAMASESEPFPDDFTHSILLLSFNMKMFKNDRFSGWWELGAEEDKPGGG